MAVFFLATVVDFATVENCSAVQLPGANVGNIVQKNFQKNFFRRTVEF